MVREEVEQRNATVVVIDSLNGYLGVDAARKSNCCCSCMNSCPTSTQQGVLTLLAQSAAGPGGHDEHRQLNISYVADVVFMFRFFEAAGRLRKAHLDAQEPQWCTRGFHPRTADRQPRHSHRSPLSDFQGVY